MGSKIFFIFILTSLFSCTLDNNFKESVKFHNQEYNFHSNGRLKVVYHKDTSNNYFEFTSFDTIGGVSVIENGIYATKEYDYRKFMYRNTTRFSKKNKPFEYLFGAESKSEYAIYYSEKDDFIEKATGRIFSFYRFPRTIKKGELLNILFFVPNPPNINRDFEIKLKHGNANDKLRSVISVNGNILNIYDNGISKTVGVKDIDVIGRITDSRGVRDSSIFSMRIFVK